MTALHNPALCRLLSRRRGKRATAEAEVEQELCTFLKLAPDQIFTSDRCYDGCGQ